MHAVLGINIQPLLTVGGVSGVIVGLSAQSVVSNMISGVNLVIPFFLKTISLNCSTQSLHNCLLFKKLLSLTLKN